jgi:hypothetical protein
MGESTDSSSDSDESIEAQGRFDDFGIGQDTSQSQGFSSSDVKASYNQAQADIQNAYASGQALGANLGNVTAQDMGLNTVGNTLAQQDFAREQSFFDQNPMSTAIDAPLTSRMADINVGAGDIFGLKNQIANKLSQGGTAVFNNQGDIVGATGQTPLFGMPFLPNVTTYTGRNEFNPFGDPTMGSDDNPNPVTTPTVTNPISGKEQCPDGYVFDNDLQACRLKTRADDVAGTPKDPVDMNAPAFTRNYSLLNTTPRNVPQGFDFNQANQNFMSRFATRPSIFKQPPNLLGFTPFRSS